MTIYVRSTDVATIPVGKAAAFAREYAALVGRLGGSITSADTILQSPELLELGLSVQDVETLVRQSPSIDTVEQLTALTEAEVLALENVKYPRLLSIKSRLHSRGLALAGERPEDFDGSVEALLQHIRTPGHIYGLVKADGFDTVADILKLEYPDAQRYRWWVSIEPLLEGRLAPTNLSRPLSDLDRFTNFGPLEDVGIHSIQDLVGLSVTELSARLSEAQPEGETTLVGNIKSYIGRLEAVLETNGRSLRQD